MKIEDINMIQSLSWIAKKKCRSKEDAQDLMQDIFIKMIRNKEKFESLSGDEKIKYTSACIYNMSVDFYRKTKSKGRSGENLPIKEEYLGYRFYQAPEVFSKLELKEVLKKSEKKEVCKTLLLVASGYKNKEVAKMTNTPVNTVLGRCRYARKFLIA